MKSAHIISVLFLSVGSFAASTSAAASVDDSVPSRAANFGFQRVRDDESVRQWWSGSRSDDRDRSGEEVAAELGDDIDEMAERYGKSADDFVELLTSDESLRVDDDGNVLYAEPLPAAPAVATLTYSGSAVFDPTKAFSLHSRPSSPKKIFLDFDGHVTSGTAWNTTYAAGKAIVSAPWDIDAAPASFSTAERNQITAIWSRVAEDYAPFDVDVTTQDPGVSGLVRSSTTDLLYGVRVVISPTNFYGAAGGIAYLNSFGSPSAAPVFVFSKDLFNDAKYMAESAAHETGHTLGLLHDGASATATTTATAYFGGQGSWAPIMGIGYYKPVTQWSKGEYLAANNLQDDTALIAGVVGVARDDHADSLAGATLIGSGVVVPGVIGSRTDRDVFAVLQKAGSLTIGVSSQSVEGNLDVRVRLLSATGAQLAVSNPAGTGVLVSYFLPTSGVYYVEVDGVGAGSPATGGYSDYGSLGGYRIMATFTP